MSKKAAQVLVESLLENGVDTVFGYPGGAILPVYDALYDSSLRHILVRHEQGAAHAADAYARATGKVGICMATSGPGATNLVTGLANAYMDSVPIVAITGQVPTDNLGRDAFQEADITGITLPITKHNYLVSDGRELPRVIAEAIHIATTGRPGPVLIDIPKDVLNYSGPFDHPVGRPRIRGYRPYPEISPAAVLEAARAINRARRPLIFVGGGVISGDASTEVRQLAEMTGFPVISTLMGLGAFPGSHPQFLGMVGMHGTFPANRATAHADLIVALGVRFDDRVTGALHKFAPHAQIVHVDIDAAELGKNVHAHIPVAGDVKAVLQALLPHVKPRQTDEWWEEIRAWCRKHPIPYPCRDADAGATGACHPESLASARLLDGAGAGLPGGPRPQSNRGPLQPHHLLWEIYRATNGDAIIVTDVGQHQMWTALFYPFDRPRQLITSGGLGTMGFGLPAAIGAQVGRPDQEVWLISGDGSLQMTCQELGTAAAYRIPIRVVIVNNGYLGMVRQWQQLFYQRRYSQVDLEAGAPDFVRLAEAYGIRGLRAANPAELADALRIMRDQPGPVVLDAVVEREANVFPMIPSGMSVDDMIVAGQQPADGNAAATAAQALPPPAAAASGRAARG